MEDREGRLAEEILTVFLLGLSTAAGQALSGWLMTPKGCQKSLVVRYLCVVFSEVAGQFWD